MIECTDAGLVRYAESVGWQKRLVAQRRRDEIEDQLLLLEHHPPVFTSGRRDASSDLRMSEAWIRSQGMEFFKTDRGGRMTYHGPGQLVGYLIFRLHDSIPGFVHKIEETLIRVLLHFHLEGHRDPRHPGIWVDNKKIASLGLHVDRGISSHGFALNVSCDLKPFDYIHPCGIRDRGVTSLEKALGWRHSMRDVKHLVLVEMAKIFGSSITTAGNPYPSD